LIDTNTKEWYPGCGLPSPEEIKAACEEIQRNWTPKERRAHAVKKKRWQVPTTTLIEGNEDE
jgi:hypothetical protein